MVFAFVRRALRSVLALTKSCCIARFSKRGTTSCACSWEQPWPQCSLSFCFATLFSADVFLRWCCRRRSASKTLWRRPTRHRTSSPELGCECRPSCRKTHAGLCLRRARRGCDKTAPTLFATASARARGCCATPRPSSVVRNQRKRNRLSLACSDDEVKLIGMHAMSNNTFSTDRAAWKFGCP